MVCSYTMRSHQMGMCGMACAYCIAQVLHISTAWHSSLPPPLMQVSLYVAATLWCMSGSQPAARKAPDSSSQLRSLIVTPGNEKL